MKIYEQTISRTEVRTGGLLLSIGALITITCILLEVNAGWASLAVDIQRSDEEAGVFLFNHWAQMQSIWGWSLLGNVIFAVAALLLFKHAGNIRWFPLSVLWAVYFTGSLLLIVSFGLSLGSYYPALEVINEQPALFLAMRGTPLYLFNLGAMSQLVLFIIFFYEGFSQEGQVPRGWAIAVLVLFVAALVLLLAGMASTTVVAIASFLVPLFLGASYWRNVPLPVGEKATQPT